MAQIGDPDASGKLIHEKNLKSKISCQTPFITLTPAVQHAIKLLMHAITIVNLHVTTCLNFLVTSYLCSESFLNMEQNWFKIKAEKKIAHLI